MYTLKCFSSAFNISAIDNHDLWQATSNRWLVKWQDNIQLVGLTVNGLRVCKSLLQLQLSSLQRFSNSCLFERSFIRHLPSTPPRALAAFLFALYVFSLLSITWRSLILFYFFNVRFYYFLVLIFSIHTSQSRLSSCRTVKAYV